MMSHTKGPWKLSTRDPENGFASNQRRYVCGAGWDSFAEVVVRMKDKDFDDPEGAANARLIAAAPDLLEVALNARKMAETMCDLTSCRGDDEWVWGFQKEIEAAISKATGAS